MNSYLAAIGTIALTVLVVLWVVIAAAAVYMIWESLHDDAS